MAKVRVAHNQYAEIESDSHKLAMLAAEAHKQRREEDTGIPHKIVDEGGRIIRVLPVHSNEL